MKDAQTYEEYYRAQQELEEKYGSNSIVLMMIGSFYEIYGLDLPYSDPPVKIGKAEEAHNVLGMNLTLKNKSKQHSRNNPYMVGFPDYALDEHIGKLLRTGMTVALYDQFDQEGSKRKGRKLAQIYTPSTYIDDTLTDSNCLLAFELVEYTSALTKNTLKKVHIAVFSMNTGKVFLLEAYDSAGDTGKAESELYRIIHTYKPSEVICCGKMLKKFDKIYDLGSINVYSRKIPPTYRKCSYQNEFLKTVYGMDSLLKPIEYLNLECHTSVLPHLIMVLQFAFEHNKLIITKIQKPLFVNTVDQLILNNDSIYQLGLVDSPLEMAPATLYKIVCLAKTAMGKRCIRDRLLNPTTNITLLEERYSLIEKLDYKNYEENLRGISDIEKKYRKMVLGTLHPYELADLKGTWSAIKKLFAQARTLFNIPKKVRDDFETFYNEYIGNFDFEMMKKCKLRDIKGSFFLDGVNETLDNMEQNIADCKRILHNLAEEFSMHIEPDKESVVKLELTDKEGWYLTTTKTRFKKLTPDFSTSFDYHGKTYTIDYKSLELVYLKSSVKIRSPVIRKISTDLQSQRSRLNEKILEEYLKLLKHYADDYGETFGAVADIIANIDFIYSAAKAASLYGYVRPIISDQQNGESYIKTLGLRHPIIERINEDEEYTRNNVELGIDEHYGSIIYGLNMCGKSTLLRAIGCQIVMAQAGMFVSCDELTYFPFRNLLSKMTIKDNMNKGQSTFMIEMLEVKNMLMRADPQTLILSDELCSSTESVSGHALVAQTLCEMTKRRSKFMLSTHLHDLQSIPIVVSNPHLKIYHFKVSVDDNNKINFDRHLVEGGMTDLYGLEVARALGLPRSFMKGAFKVRDHLTNSHSEILSTKQSRYNSNVYVHACSKCANTVNLETHHIRPQKDADENGMIDGIFHKNRKHNLEILCKACHDKETYGQ